MEYIVICIIEWEAPSIDAVIVVVYVIVHESVIRAVCPLTQIKTSKAFEQ